MTATFAEILNAVPMFALVLARVGAMIALLPGIGETVAPATARIGIAASITLLLVPVLPNEYLSPDTGGWGALSMFVAEVFTGLWFGWLVRLMVLALPIAGQMIAYLVGLSSVLQPDAELGSQASVFGKLFSLAAPLLVLTSGLYTLPLRAMAGLFVLVPIGHVFPGADSLKVAVDYVAAVFELAAQVSSPFVVVAVVWQFAMGQVARMSARMQIYFISMPGQILAGFAILMLTIDAILAAWRNAAGLLMAALPGAG